MLKRQAILLRFLERADRQVSHFEIVKWSFILKQETSSKGGDSFFDFLPYKKGPFSFCLYQEAGKLENKGYMAPYDDNHWIATDKSSTATATLDNVIKSDVDRIIERFSKKTKEELVDYVYSRNPWFTVNNLIRKEQTRPVATPMVFTSGYQSLSVDSFLNRLMRTGIQRIIDVRSNPIARRYGFHKSTLMRLCGYLGLDYIHVPELGIPSSLRRNLETIADYEKLFTEYEKTVLVEQTVALERVSALMSEKPSVLVCMEADPKYCHRTRIARSISLMTEMSIQDLGSEP